VGGIVLIALLWVLIPAMTAPGNDSFAANLAESARDHGFGFVVTGLEAVQYQLSPPTVGGSLDAHQKAALAGDSRPSGASSGDRASAVTLQAPVPPVLTPALPGEGDYVSRVLVHGQPAVQTALLRPDAEHTSYLAGVAWMSSKLLRFEQHPGASDPGQLTRWNTGPTVPVAERAALVATFNSGFKIQDAGGAYYQNGRTVGRLTPGAASFVIRKDGTATVAAWGRDAALTPDVVAVRQNLGLLVDGGRLAKNIDANVLSTWGATLGSKTYTWRSGVGVTAAGDIVYVVGDALSARSLAVLLQHAGTVRAMELDINRSWISFMWYLHTRSAITPHKIVDFRRPADRYFTVNSRDFFAVLAR